MESTRGRYGAYRLRPGFKLPPLMLTEDEALAIELGLLIARRSGLSDQADAIEGALAKIERVLPVAVRERVQAVQESLVIPTARTGAAFESGFITTLGTGSHQRRPVHVRYRAWSGEETERRLDPYGLVHRAGFWYVVGYCHLRQSIRVFRLDRVLSAELTEGTFTPPADFDCLEHVERAIAQTPGTWKAEILLHTTLDDARPWISPAVATLESVPGGVLLRCQTEQLPWIARLLAGLPFTFDVLQPPALNAELRILGQRLLAAAETLAPRDEAARPVESQW